MSEQTVVGRLVPDFARPSSRLDSAQERRVGQGEIEGGRAIASSTAVAAGRAELNLPDA